METNKIKNPLNDTKNNTEALIQNAGNKLGLDKLSPREDGITKNLESQTARIPSSLFLTAGVLSVAAAAVLKLGGRDKDAGFVGQWVAPFLLLGIYNKIVKTSGHDEETDLH